MRPTPGDVRKKFVREKILSSHAELGPHQFLVVLDNLKATFNVGKIFRTASAFGVRALHLINIPQFNPYPAKGAFKQTRSHFHEKFDECFAQLTEQNFTVFAFDPKAPESLKDVQFPEKSAFVFGHEEFGLSFDPKDYPSIRTLYIPQWGKVQSLNVSNAASIVLYEYVRQHGQGEGRPPELRDNRYNHLEINPRAQRTLRQERAETPAPALEL